MMHSLLFCAIYVYVSLCVVSSKKLSQLQIIPEHIPDDCYEKTSTGDQIMVHYTGKLESGAVFDSSRQRQEPITLTLGQGQVIPGWEQGLLDMCVGEKRMLVIPPHLAYGQQGSPPQIPPDSTLLFETELVGIVRESFSDILARMARFMIYPGIAGIIIYYLYNKYQNDTVVEKREKQGSRTKKSKRRN